MAVVKSHNCSLSTQTMDAQCRLCVSVSSMLKGLRPVCWRLSLENRHKSDRNKVTADTESRQPEIKKSGQQT